MLGAEQKADLGLADSEERVTVEVDGEARVLRVGGSVFGSGDRYVESVADGGVYVLAGSNVSGLQNGGDIVYVDLPKTGARVEQGKALGSVESVKAVSDIYAPVSGEVTEVNAALADAPEKLNEDPHGAGWLVKVKLSDPGEAGGLMNAADYESYVGAEK